MAYIEDGTPVGWSGIFYKVAFYIEEVQFTLQALNMRLPDHWPFMGIKDCLGDIGDHPTGVNKWLAWLVAAFWKADTWAIPLVDDIAERVRTWDLDGLIESYAPGVWSFFQDVKGKIKDRIKEWSQAGYDLIDDPLGELNDWLEVNYPPLWSFKEDPKQYVLDRLKEQSTELYDFALDPLGWLSTQISDLRADVTAFLEDPSGAVYDHLVKIDSPLAPFWADPWDTMLTEIGERAGLPEQWWEDVPDMVLGWVVDSFEYIIAECVFRFW